MLLEIGNQRDDFLGDELLGRLADQALIVGEFRGRENIFGARRFEIGSCRRERQLRGGAVVAMTFSSPSSRLTQSASRQADALENSGGAHAAADAHGHHTVARLAALEFAQDRGRELGAGAAERMAESDGAAIGIDARGIEAGQLNHGKRLRGEGFVQLDHVDLIERRGRPCASALGMA